MTKLSETMLKNYVGYYVGECEYTREASSARIDLTDEHGKSVFTLLVRALVGYSFFHSADSMREMNEDLSTLSVIIDCQFQKMDSAVLFNQGDFGFEHDGISVWRLRIDTSTEYYEVIALDESCFEILQK